MTKTELIDQISQRASITRVKAQTVVDTVFDSMVESLIYGDRIEIRGFGSWSVRDYPAYDGRNPRNGEIIKVPAKRMPFFKVGKQLKEEINSERP